MAGARAALARAGTRQVTLLQLVERIRAVELRLAGVRAAGDALGKFGHALGNAIQVVELASLALVRTTPSSESLIDLRGASERASEVLAAMVAATIRPPRATLGPAVAPAIRAAVELARPAIAASIELRVELIDEVASRLAGDELEAIVLACVLDVADAPHLAFVLRERTIDGARWIELVRIDASGELELVVAPPSWLGVVDQLGREVGGELTLSTGRTGRELVLAWPVGTDIS